jgi:hypothetical protein
MADALLAEAERAGARVTVLAVGTLPAIVRGLTSRGLRPVTLTELLSP